MTKITVIRDERIKKVEIRATPALPKQAKTLCVPVYQACLLLQVWR